MGPRVMEILADMCPNAYPDHVGVREVFAMLDAKFDLLEKPHGPLVAYRDDLEILNRYHPYRCILMVTSHQPGGC